MPGPEKIPESGAYIHEAKLDGWRMQVHRASHEIRLYSLKGFDLSARLPGLACSILSSLAVDEVIVDGELVL